MPPPEAPPNAGRWRRRVPGRSTVWTGARARSRTLYPHRAESSLPRAQNGSPPHRMKFRWQAGWSRITPNQVSLPVEKVLEKLKRWMPAQYELAEVVGKWIWITFPEPPEERIRAELSQLG